jgi:hypothetical protein
VKTYTGGCRPGEEYSIVTFCVMVDVLRDGGLSDLDGPIQDGRGLFGGRDGVKVCGGEGPDVDLLGVESMVVPLGEIRVVGWSALILAALFVFS